MINQNLFSSPMNLWGQKIWRAYLCLFSSDWPKLGSDSFYDENRVIWIIFLMDLIKNYLVTISCITIPKKILRHPIFRGGSIPPEFWILVFFILNLISWSHFCANMSEFGAKKKSYLERLFYKNILRLSFERVSQESVGDIYAMCHIVFSYQTRRPEFRFRS